MAAVPVYDGVLHTCKNKPEDGDNRLPQKLFVAVYDVRRPYSCWDTMLVLNSLEWLLIDVTSGAPAVHIYSSPQA